MKITPEDMDDVRAVLAERQGPYDFLLNNPDAPRDIALVLILARIYDRGYEQGHTDACNQEYFKQGECPYDFVAHTKHWCGYAGCRDS